MTENLVGSVSWPVFLFVTIVLFGWFSFMTASALARVWRPWWQNIMYGLILGVADRLLEMMLYRGSLLSLRAYVIDTAYILVVMLVSYRIAQSHAMVGQYPWLYERSGLFGWRAKGGT
jgi:branched-chain amino acid transport system ATP-binding protein